MAWLPAGLLLEQADGRQDLVSSSELVDLLAPARRQIKLVTVSSCFSAALTAAEHLRLLGIETVEPAADEPASDGEPLPAVATELVARLGCAVLAMRYPIVDDFAIGLAGRLYDLRPAGSGRPPSALGHHQSVDDCDAELLADSARCHPR